MIRVIAPNKVVGNKEVVITNRRHSFIQPCRYVFPSLTFFDIYSFSISSATALEAEKEDIKSDSMNAEKSIGEGASTGWHCSSCEQSVCHMHCLWSTWVGRFTVDEEGEGVYGDIYWRLIL